MSSSKLLANLVENSSSVSPEVWNDMHIYQQKITIIKGFQEHYVWVTWKVITPIMRAVSMQNKWSGQIKLVVQSWETAKVLHSSMSKMVNIIGVKVFLKNSPYPERLADIKVEPWYLKICQTLYETLTQKYYCINIYWKRKTKKIFTI